MTDPLLAVGGPVFTVAGELERDLARDCLRLEVEEGVEGLRTMRAQFAAVGAGATGPPGTMLYVDGKILDFGKTLQVAVGPESAQRNVFDGVVSGLELVFGDSEPPRVVVLAEDALMRLRMTRRMRTYRRVTDADIVDQVAQEHGLTADLKVEGPRYDVVQQLNQSDLAFLRERARLVQGELWCTGSTLHFSTRPRREGTRLTLVQGTDLLSTRVLADLAHQRTEVAVTGYDASTKSAIDERAGGDTVKAESSGGRTGPSIVTRAFGQDKSVPLSFRVRDAALSGTEASAWAKAEMLRRARGFVTVSAMTRGTADMVVGSLLRLELIGPPFEGDGYYVTRVCHTFDHVQGLRTRFEAERASINEVA
jgi:phage protein D